MFFQPLIFPYRLMGAISQGLSLLSLTCFYIDVLIIGVANKKARTLIIIDAVII